MNDEVRPRQSCNEIKQIFIDCRITPVFTPCVASRWEARQPITMAIPGTKSMSVNYESFAKWMITFAKTLIIRNGRAISKYSLVSTWLASLRTRTWRYINCFSSPVSLAPLMLIICSMGSNCGSSARHLSSEMRMRGCDQMDSLDRLGKSWFHFVGYGPMSFWQYTPYSTSDCKGVEKLSCNALPPS